MISQRLLSGPIEHEYLGDCDAANRVIGTGMSQALAYMKRTAGLSFQWAKEHIAPFLKGVESELNLADIFTKALEPEKFHAFRVQLGIY